MYLEAKRHVAPCDSQTETMRRAVGAAIGYEPLRSKPGHDESLLEVCGVTVRVGYWRKFVALHQWFVGNVQGGHDDDRPSYVSVEILMELTEQLEQVSDYPENPSSRQAITGARLGHHLPRQLVRSAHVGDSS